MENKTERSSDIFSYDKFCKVWARAFPQVLERKHKVVAGMAVMFEKNNRAYAYYKNTNMYREMFSMHGDC